MQNGSQFVPEIAQHFVAHITDSCRVVLRCLPGIVKCVTDMIAVKLLLRKWERYLPGFVSVQLLPNSFRCFLDVGSG